MLAGGRRWRPGRISAIHIHGYVSVIFESDLSEERVHRSHLRLPKALTHRMALTKYPEDHLARPRLNLLSRRDREGKRSTATTVTTLVRNTRSKSQVRSDISTGQYGEEGLSKKKLRVRAEKPSLNPSKSITVDETSRKRKLPEELPAEKLHKKQRKYNNSSNKTTKCDAIADDFTQLTPSHVLLAEHRPSMRKLTAPRVNHLEDDSIMFFNEEKSRRKKLKGGSSVTSELATKAEIRAQIERLKLAKTQIEGTILYFEKEYLRM